MTLDISKETAELISEVMAKSKFSSADDLLQYVLAQKLAEEALFEDEAFIKRVRAALARSQKAVAEGRVYEIPKGKLADVIREREERINFPENVHN